MVQGKHAGGAGRYWAVGAVAGGVLLAVAVGGLWLNERGDGPLRAAPATSSSSAPSIAPPAITTPSPTPSTTTRTVPAGLRACEKAVEAAERLVSEAGTGADHWRRHVKAYRDVVDGRIPYAAADREWRVTREAGPGDVRRFARAERAYRGVADDCQGVTQEAGAELSATAQACADRRLTAAEAVSSGRRVMAQWDGHLDDMAARVSHRLSDGQARVLLRAAVREAPGRLTTFERAREALDDAPTCELPAA